VHLGQTALGFVAVTVFGLGMAVTLTAAGLTVITVLRGAGRLSASRPRLHRLTEALPRLAPAGVLAAGVAMTIRAAGALV
jgi:ABC-type nickel/cobalt efflux system permease component RcnA